jgi:hypothetical protein
MDIAVIDVPAVLAFGVSAAAELGHAASKRGAGGRVTASGYRRENFSELERAETKFPSDDVRRRRRRNERKRRVWKLLPDRKIFRRDSEPSESEHVSARFSHSSGLCPCDLIDGGQSFPLRRQLRFVGGLRFF